LPKDRRQEEVAQDRFLPRGDPRRGAGLRIRAWNVLADVISGPKGTVAAIFLASRILSIAPLGGQGLKLAAIAAAVIGIASLYSGHGSIIGTCSAPSSRCSSATG
jgi:ribose transport system permease protein